MQNKIKKLAALNLILLITTIMLVTPAGNQKVLAQTNSGEDCGNIEVLSGATGSVEGTTVDYNNDGLATTGIQYSPDHIYSIDVPAGYTLTMGQSVNNYDSYHRMAYGGTCTNGSPVGTTTIAEVDDPDIQSYIYTNEEESTVTVYWINAGYWTNSGNYTLDWTLEGPAGPPPDAITDVSATAGDGFVNLSWTAPFDNGFPITGYIVRYGIDFVVTCENESCTDTIPGATITGLPNFEQAQFRVYATNGNGNSPPSNTAYATPIPCDIDFNLETEGTTTSGQCVGMTVNYPETGGLFIANAPRSFSFPNRFTTNPGYNQSSFSNIDGTTGPNGMNDPFGDTQQYADEDVLTITDLRNQGGFQVTISADRFGSGPDNEIPLRNLYVTTTYPTGNDLPDNPELLGATQSGITYALGYYGTRDITDTVDTTYPVNQASTFTTFGRSFDFNNDGFPEPIVLMYTETAHSGSFSNALSFYINIPGGQPAGVYSTLFTIDLTPIGGGIGP